jgi:indole-3-glycerol phosphate synthase
MTPSRRFSQAISEGDGISLVAEVDSSSAASAAEDDGAEAVLVRSGNERILRDVRAATSLPILFFADGEQAEALDGADACVVDGGDVDDEWLDRIDRELGNQFELVVRVDDEDSLVAVLDGLDPELFLLAAPSNRSEHALDHVLGLLPDVPAGKLAVAELPQATGDEVAELERAGFDAVIVGAGDVAALAREPHPEP